MDTANDDLRNLLPDAPGTDKCCSICGKPKSRNHKALNDASPAHAYAVKNNLASRYRMLVSALGRMAKDCAEGKAFNAQVEQFRKELIAARREHDAYTPDENLSDKQEIIRTLTQTLSMLGVKVDGTHTPLALADAAQIELAKLLLALDNAGISTKDLGLGQDGQ